MVRFIRYWIERSMETPEAREEKARLHLEEVAANAKKLKERWDLPSKTPGYWNAPSATHATALHAAEAEALMLSPYDRALADMDASKAAKERERK